MNDVTDTPPEDSLPLTGERTVPGIAEENYWFRRHEVVYREFAAQCFGKTVLEAGSGEGYGADIIAAAGGRVVGLDYDRGAAEHVRRRYPKVDMLRGNLATLPFRTDAVEVIVNLQVIEHLWDQEQFLRECHRVLAPQGRLIVSTPNRLTFSPGRDTPLNPFHTRELAPGEMRDLMHSTGFRVDSFVGVHHGDRLAALDRTYGGSFIDAQIDRALAGEPWPEQLTRDVAAVSAADFDIRGGDLDASLDLVVVATKAAAQA